MTMTIEQLAQEIAEYAVENWSSKEDIKKQYEWQGRSFTLKASHAEAKLIRQASGKPQQMYSFGYHSVEKGKLHETAIMGIENFIKTLAK